MTDFVDQVTIAGGVPVAGDGIVPTLAALMADGGQGTIGAQADAAQPDRAQPASLVALAKGQFGLAAGANIAGGPVPVGATDTPLAAARPGRGQLRLLNEGSTPVRVGPPGVTWATGYLMPAQEMVLSTNAAVHAITQSGSAVVSVMEIF